jgi:hypothetical protein
MKNNYLFLLPQRLEDVKGIAQYYDACGLKKETTESSFLLSFVRLQFFPACLPNKLWHGGGNGEMFFL